MPVRFGVLGPLETHVDGRPVPMLNAPKQRVLLSALLLHSNTFLSTSDLIDILWDTRRPVDARATLQVHMTRVRRALELHSGDGTQPIRTLDDGYLIDVQPGQLDLSEFTEAVAGAESLRAAGDLTAEGRVLREALALWRGDVLADVPCDRLRTEHAGWLTEQRLQVTERSFDVELELGHHQDVLPRIEVCARRHPMRERLWAQLITALYRSGQQARALATFHTVRRMLDAELGVEPGPELSALHLEILSGPAAGAPPTAPWQPQCQLPADIADFAGREKLIETVTTRLAPQRHDTVPPVVVLVGSPGTGKSALATHIAHQVRHEFPDGQWYARLGGTTGVPGSPAEIMARLLRASGVSEHAIPRGTEALAAAFRARLADRRVLLVLDDAGSSAQIIPFLPGTPGSSVLVTSRYDLTDLVALQGAHPVGVATLTRAESVTLLARVLGASRIDAEPRAALELAELCGGLPLALRTAAATLDRRQDGIAAYVAEVGRGNRLAHFTVAGHAAVRAAFDVSYGALAEPDRKIFRLLGVMPVATVTTQAVAALTAMSPTEARRGLDTLATAHLVEADGEGRFRFLGLLRYYAAERASVENSPDEQTTILRRLFDWYVGGAAAAIAVLYPEIENMPLPPPVTGVRIPAFTEREAARGWLRVEGINLMTALRHAVDFNCPAFGWQLVDALRGYFQPFSHSIGWVAAAESGLRAAMELEDQRSIVAMRLGLGLVLRCSGQFDEAEAHLVEASSLAHQLGMLDFECAALNAIGVLHSAAGRTEAAVEPLREMLDLARHAGFRPAEASALRSLGAVYRDLGRLSQAHRACTLALNLDRRMGAWHYQAGELNALGYVHADLGRYDEAAGCFQEAFELSQDLDLRRDRANALCGLAAVDRHRGRPKLAVLHARRALRSAQEAGDGATEAWAMAELGTAYHAAGKPELALRWYERGLGQSRETGQVSAEAQIRIGLAHVHHGNGSTEQAAGHALDAVHLAARFQLLVAEARAHAVLAEIRLDRGQVVLARQSWLRRQIIQQQSGCHLDSVPRQQTRAPTFVPGPLPNELWRRAGT
jgi:DNA-binding SARP family transcriptional activator/tetratricopeptide (TPR) repeat protein